MRKRTPVRLIIATTLLILPLAFDPYVKDSFRFPKELLFRGSAIALLAAGVWYATKRNTDLRSRVREELRDPAVLVTIAIVVWVAIATLFSLNRTLSVDSLITVVASAIFFLGCRAALRQGAMPLLNIVMFTAALNALLAILQEYGIWQPFQIIEGAIHEEGVTALLGNPNDVGSFLLVPAVVALITAILTRRITWVSTAVLLVTGLIASGTRTAILAYLVALVVAGITTGGRVRLAAVGAAMVVALLILWPGTELGRRYWEIVESAATGRFDLALSQRAPAFLSAVDMFRDRPVAGTGPGTYKWLYMRYRVELSGHYPAALVEGWPASFAEAHNDHLQIAAETGVVGYLLLVTGTLVVARPRRAAAGIAAHLRWPVVAAAVILMLAQFPLQLAAPRMLFLFFAAFCTTATGESR